MLTSSPVGSGAITFAAQRQRRRSSVAPIAPFGPKDCPTDYDPAAHQGALTTREKADVKEVFEEQCGVGEDNFHEFLTTLGLSTVGLNMKAELAAIGVDFRANPVLQLDQAIAIVQAMKFHAMDTYEDETTQAFRCCQGPDGIVTSDTIKVMCDRFDLHLDLAMLEEMDENGDGQVDADEFRALLNANSDNANDPFAATRLMMRAPRLYDGDWQGGDEEGSMVGQSEDEEGVQGTEFDFSRPRRSAWMVPRSQSVLSRVNSLSVGDGASKLVTWRKSFMKKQGASAGADSHRGGAPHERSRLLSKTCSTKPPKPADFLEDWKRQDRVKKRVPNTRNGRLDNGFFLPRVPSSGGAGSSHGSPASTALSPTGDGAGAPLSPRSMRAPNTFQTPDGRPSMAASTFAAGGGGRGKQSPLAMETSMMRSESELADWASKQRDPPVFARLSGHGHGHDHNPATNLVGLKEYCAALQREQQELLAPPRRRPVSSRAAPKLRRLSSSGVLGMGPGGGDTGGRRKSLSKPPPPPRSVVGFSRSPSFTATLSSTDRFAF